MNKRARISALWEIVYYLDTWIVYLAVRETEYAVFSLPRKKNGLGTRLCLAMLWLGKMSERSVKALKMKKDVGMTLCQNC